MLKKRISYFMGLLLILCLAVSPILASEKDYIAPLYNEDQIGWDKALGSDKVRVTFEVDMDMERATDQVDSVTLPKTCRHQETQITAHIAQNLYKTLSFNFNGAT